MALDTRDRRASAVHVGLPWRGLLPLPDVGAEDQGDRQQVGLVYRGILAGPSNVVHNLSIGTLVVVRPGVGAVTAVVPGVGLVALIRAGLGAVTLEEP